MRHDLKFHTQYHQFYLTSDEGGGLDSDWDDQAQEDRMALLKNAIVVFTECYGPIKGELVILDQPPLTRDLSTYDHVVEGGILIDSGVLKVLDCPHSIIELEVRINPGTYRVRVYSSNFASVVGDEGDDYYKIEMWPDNNLERKVLKRYKRIEPGENQHEKSAEEPH